MNQCTEISRRVLKLITTDRNPLLDDAAKEITKDDLVCLREIVERKAIPPTEFSMPSAMYALARCDSSAEAVQVLGHFIGNEDETVLDRIIAAIVLRVSSGEAIEETLIQYLGVTQSVIRDQVIKSLGTLGGPAALKALDRFGEFPRMSSREILTFARALITHRLGLVGEFEGYSRRPGRIPKEYTGRKKLRLQPLDQEKLDAQVRKLEDTRYGIEPGMHAFEFKAGRARWTLFLNSALDESSKTLFRQKWITALIARWDDRTDRASVQFLVLTQPVDDNDVQISVVRTDGRLMYTGKFAQNDEGLKFALTHVDRPGAVPLKAEGRVTKEGVAVAAAFSEAERTPTQSGDGVILEEVLPS